MDKEKIVLVEDKKKCCGCSACMNICPKNAITMVKDEYGFTYPKIDEEKCIKCGLCKKTCAYQKEEKNKKWNIPQNVYASATSNENIISNSTSGGISGEICNEFLNDDGIIYGCSMENDRDGTIFPEHIRVDNKENLEKIQGSKYVKSQMNYTYKNLKEDLAKNNKVLFTGTPCQIDALYSYLENTKTDVKNLYTIDIICHGVPDTKFFQDYIRFCEKKLNCKIQNLKFRDKKSGEYGWSLHR